MDNDVLNYSVEGRIGEGAHGLVFKALHLPTGREVALKKILIKNLEDGIPVNVMREIKSLQLLRCKYMDNDVLNYSVEGRIGEGAHGLVFKALHLPTGREVALKKILIKNLEDGIPVNVMREIKSLQLLRCKYMDNDVLNYSVEGRIGEGAHGLVFKALHLPTGREVALKKILIKNLEDGIPVNVMREIKSLQLLRCKYIIKLFDMFPRGMSLVLVLEYMCSGLWDMLHHHQQELTLPTVKTYASMLLKGTRYMHDHYIMHRDLKPANLLINHEGILKIADLGLARLFWPDGGRPYSHQVATRWYRAPELLYGARYYTEKVDLWAVGCIIAEMITKKPLFAGESDIEQLAIVLRHLGTPTEENWPGHGELPDYHKISFPESAPTPWPDLLPGVEPDAIQLIKSFIRYDSKKRITPKEALKHEWFHNRPLPLPLEDMPKPLNFTKTK